MTEKRITVLQEMTREAGFCLMTYFRKPLKVEHKSHLDLVTEADLASELLIKNRLRDEFPEDAILAEESGSQMGSSCYRWVIDPLDGTTNFSHSLPHFAVSIALEKDGVLFSGAVYDPAKDEMFEATRGKGARLNGKTISVSSCHDPEQALSVSGFPYNRREQLPLLLSRVERALAHFQGFRRFGAASLDLAYIAAGRFDLFWETGLKPWDLAAGVLLIQEAGGIVTDLSGNKLSLDRGEILTANQAIHQKALLTLTN